MALAVLVDFFIVADCAYFFSYALLLVARLDI
jgi:hypothetical protein